MFFGLAAKFGGGLWQELTTSSFWHTDVRQYLFGQVTGTSGSKRVNGYIWVTVGDPLCFLNELKLYSLRRWRCFLFGLLVNYHFSLGLWCLKIIRKFDNLDIAEVVLVERACFKQVFEAFGSKDTDLPFIKVLNSLFRWEIEAHKTGKEVGAKCRQEEVENLSESNLLSCRNPLEYIRTTEKIMGLINREEKGCLQVPRLSRYCSQVVSHVACDTLISLV